MKKELSQEDAEVWSKYSRGLKRLPNSETSARSIKYKNTRKTFSVPSAREAVIHSNQSEKYSHTRVGDILSAKHIDKKKLRDLQRGRIQPEATLDLHGLKRFEAQEKVHRFVENSIQKKLRLILIITGKGKRSIHTIDSGVLRKEFPKWVSSLPNSNKILGIIQASVFHGGSGAFYVYMRKPS